MVRKTQFLDRIADYPITDVTRLCPTEPSEEVAAVVLALLHRIPAASGHTEAEELSPRTDLLKIILDNSHLDILTAGNK